MRIGGGRVLAMKASANVDPSRLDVVAQAAGAQRVARTQVIQPLWSGYGELFRAELVGGEHFSVIVKHIRLPKPARHPRGWSTDTSHQRKLKSYRVEVNWYRDYVGQSGEAGSQDDVCPMPRCLFVERRDDEVLLVLEDLHTRGFHRVLERVGNREIQACLGWLAQFHARSLGVPPQGLWKTGTYWHLATRPDELDALTDAPLKAAAPQLDALLSQCPYQTLVHGDAKLANFLFDASGRRVAAVDFQYVGRGCGMKDVVMLLSSTVPPEDCERRCPALLDDYFRLLAQALREQPAGTAASAVDAAVLEQAWRPLFSVAWADFQRFLKGWSPGHWKLHAYSDRLTREALARCAGWG